MFIKGDVVYSKPNNVRNVVLGYKHILNEGFEYQMAMKPENTLIKKLYICIMKFINKIFRRS